MQKYKKFKYQSGFTLLELIISMMIIAALTVGLWANFTTTLVKGKDSRRKQDLDSVGRALEIYYQDYKAFPTPPFTLWGSAFVNDSNSNVIYMSKVPQDPGFPVSSYCYASDTRGTYYQIYTNLENATDAKVFPTPVKCNNKDYNYGISSTNTNP
jgi:prepilin-type N-terminal cleavage/methylation domain-containing protein